MNLDTKKIVLIGLTTVIICVVGALYSARITPDLGAWNPVQREYVIDVPLQFAATSTAAVSSVPLARVKAQANYLCTMPWVDFTTANGRFGAGITMGTTTSAGDVSLTNTSTVTLMASNKMATSSAPQILSGFGGYARDNGAASPTGIANSVTFKGSYYDNNTNATTSPWLFVNGQYLVVSWDYSGATSTDSVMTANNFAGVARLKSVCYPRN